MKCHWIPPFQMGQYLSYGRANRDRKRQCSLQKRSSYFSNRLRTIANAVFFELALQGYSPDEIGPHVGRTTRSVQRVLARVREQLTIALV